MSKEKSLHLYEYIYGIFEPFEASFLSGEYNIHINQKVYKLHSREVAIINNRMIELFSEFQPFLNHINSQPDFKKYNIPSEHLTIIDYSYYQQISKDFFQDEKLLNKIRCLTKHYYQCLLLKIPHKYEGDPFQYLDDFVNKGGFEKSLDVYLRAIKEFQDYHILSESPNVYLSDIHFRKMEGIYSYCTDSNDEVFTKVKPRLDCWTPKKADNAEEKATEYFEAGNNYDIADMLMARARVYAQQKNCSLAILHAIMSLEIVVPRMIDEYLRDNKISNKVINTFGNRMDLSMRVKIFLKIIYPNDIHEIIDKVGEAIILRNKIIHCGFKESSLNSKEVSELVDYCYILKKLLAIH